MMTWVGLGMLGAFGFLAFRHFRNGRVIWGVIASFGSLLGAASLWVDYQRAMMPAEAGERIEDRSVARQPEEGPRGAQDDVFGKYDPQG